MIESTEKQKVINFISNTARVSNFVEESNVEGSTSSGADSIRRTFDLLLKQEGGALIGSSAQGATFKSIALDDIDENYVFFTISPTQLSPQTLDIVSLTNLIESQSGEEQEESLTLTNTDTTLPQQTSDALTDGLSAVINGTLNKGEKAFLKEDDYQFTVQQIMEGFVNIGDPYTDHLFKLDLPYAGSILKDLKKIELPAPSVFQIDTEYNFYLPQYEDSLEKLSPVQDLEVYLPNYYSILSQLKYSGEQSMMLSQEVIKNNTLGGKLSSSKYFSGASFYDQYFIDYANVLLNVGSATPIANYFMTSENLDLLDLGRELRSALPFSVKLSFDTNHKSNFSEIIRQVGAEKALLQKVLLLDSADEAPEKIDILFSKTQENVIISETESTEDFSIEVGASISSAPQSVLNIEDIFLSEQDNSTLADEVVFLGKNSGSSNMSGFQKSFLQLIYKGKLNSFVKNYERDLKSVFEGKKSYSEVVYYSIEKYKVSSTGEIADEPLQRFYFSNSSGLERFDFYDSQVLYGRKYKYVLNAFVVVLGNAYSYNSLDIEGGLMNAALQIDSKFYAKVGYTNNYSLVLTKVPMTEQSLLDEGFAVVFDNPPVQPDVLLRPIKNSNGDLNIFLNSGVGDYIDLPIALTGDERSHFDEISMLQGLSPYVRFKNEEPVTRYEIFRKILLPEEDLGSMSYTDFKEDLYTTINNPLAASAEYKDSLLLDRDYLYFFRAVDDHENKSNPTEVYRVRLISDGGGNFIDFDIAVVEFKNKKKRSSYVRTARRLITIQAPPDQVFLKDFGQDVESAYDTELLVGQKEQSLFVPSKKDEAKTRKFKVRLTSRGTGRQIDVNLRFVHKHKLQEKS